MANRINYTIGYTVDKTGLQQLQSLFQTIAFQAQEPANKMNAGLQQAGRTATQLDAILEKCFNQDLGTLNVTRFNQELKKANLTTTQIKADLAGAGATGSMAFNNLGSSILKTNIQLKQTNKLLDSMAVSMANTVKWGITSSIFNTVTSSISKSVNYAKQLDKSLNNIRIVTGKSKDEMAEFAVEANNAAKSLGASTLDYTNASLIYAQQGLSDAEVKARAEVTVKAANVTGQTGEEVSEQLTAVWNGYKVTAAETELYVDKLAAVAASTAADLEELSTGMSKVAAAANSMGVDIDQLNAQLSTIISVTRQAPESAGTALKTIYARMADLKLGETDEDGVGLGYVSAEMTKIGVNVLDANGNLKDMGDVVEEVAEKWDKLSKAQQVSIASAMAGKRQYNNLIALFDNWDMYTEALETSQNAMGTLQEQQDIYTESTAAKLKELKATWEDLYGSLIDNDELNTGIDGLKNLVQIFDNFIDSFGGGIKAIGAFGIIVANIFNKQIANAIIHAKVEQQKYQNNMQVLLAQQEAIQQGALKTGTQASTLESQAIVKGYEKQLEYAKQIYMVRKGITSEQYNEYMQDAAILKQEVEKEFILRSQMEAELLKADFKSRQIQKMIEEMGYAEQVKNNLGEAEIFLDEQVNSISTLNTLYDKNLSFAKKRKELENFINENNKKADALKQNSLKIDKRVLNNLKNTEQVQKAIIKTSQQILDINEKSREKFNQQGKAITFIESKMNKYADATGKVSAVTAGLNTKLEQAKVNVSTFSTIGKILPTLSTFAMAWSSVSSAIQTVTDDTASFGDKVTQIMMMLGMTLPMMTSAMQSLSAATGYEVTLTEVLNAKKKASLALDDAQILASNKKIIVRGKELIGTKTLAAEMQKEATAQGINVALLGKEEKLRIIRAAAQTAGITLTKAEEAAILEATIAQNAWNASMLANPVMLLVAGMGTLIGVISAVKTAEEEAARKAEEAEQKRIDKLNERIAKTREALKVEKETQAEIEKEEDIYLNYKNLLEQYKEGIDVKDQLEQTSQSLIDIYQIENGNIIALAGNYELLEEKARAAMKARLEEKYASAVEGSSLAGSAMEDTTTEQWNKYSIKKQKTEDIWLDNDITDNVTNGKTHTVVQLRHTKGKRYNSKGELYDDKGFASSLDKATSYLAYYDKIQGVKQEKLGINPFTLDMYVQPNKDSFFLSTGYEYEKDKQEDIVAQALENTGLFTKTGRILETYNESLYKDSELIYNAVAGDVSGFLYQGTGDKTADTIALYDSLLKVYEQLKDPNSQYYIEAKNREDNELYSKIENFLNSNQEDVEAYREAKKTEATTKLVLDKFDNIMALDEAESYEAFKTQADDLLEAANLVATDLGYENGQAYMEELLSYTNSSYKNTYLALMNMLAGSELQGDTLKELQDYLTNLSTDEISSVLKLYVNGYIDEKSTKDDIIKQLKQLKTLLPYDVTNIELTASLSAQALEGKIDEETIKQLREYNNGEYENQLVDFENKSLKEQLEILKQITEEQQKENAIAISGAESRRQAKIDEIQAEIDLKEAKKEVLEKQLEENPSNHSLRADIGMITNEINNLQQILDEGVDFDIDIDTSALDYYESKVQTIVSYTDLLQNSTALIGEGWKVAQEDVAKFAQMYPELMRNAEVLETGELQLNEAILKDKLGLDEDIINSDTETTAQQLKNQMAILKAQLAYTETKRDILKQQLQGEINQSEAEKALEETETKYANEMNQIEIKDEQAAGYQIINDAANTSTEVQNHLHNIALKASQVGSIIIDALSGKKVDVSGFAKIFSSEISKKEDIFKTTGSDLGSTEEQIKAARAKYTEKEYQKIVDEFNLTEDELDRLNNLYGDYATILSKLYANRDEAIEGIGNAVSGKGNKEEDKDERDEEKKNYDDEFDRYWQLNKTIDKTTESIDDLQNAQDNLFGEELQANLAKTNRLLDTQIANYQALYAEQQKEAAELRTILSQSGAAFDPAGALTNYAAITEQALATYNQAVQAYNAHLIDDAAFETATTVYETFIENLERYDDLFYGEMIDTINEIEDREREKLENALSGWEAVIEVNLDEDSMARDWNDFISEMNKDFTREFEDIGAELQRIATDVEYFPSTIYTDLNAVNTVMQEMTNLQNGLGSTMFESVSQAEDKLRELTEQLMSDAEEMKGLYEEAWDAYLEGIDQAAEKLEKVMQEFENIDAELEYQGELIELIYGPEAYDLMDSLYKGQQKNMFAQIQSLQTQYDTWKQMYEAAEEGSADQVKYYDLMNEAQSNLNDSVIEYIELLKDEYSNTVSDILKKVEKEITGGSTFDDVEEQWDRLMEKSDKYLDNLEGLYEVQSIANDTQAEIADMSDLKDQQKLQTLLDKELKQLREKDKLTKYDLDAAKARLEIAKAEIALEDARASKTSMRLTRGDDGNWSYQYIADADNVASKQQELMDAMNDYYQLTKDAHQESLESMMDLQIKLKEELEEIANSEVLTEEEKYAKMQEIQAYYEEQMTLLAEENELYKQNLSAATAGLAWNLYSQDAINFEAMTAAEQGLIQDLETTMVTSYDNIMVAATTDFATIELAVVENINDIGAAADNVATINIPAMTSAAQEMANRWSADDGTGIKATITGAIESIKTAMGQYQTKVDGVAKEVGEDFGKQGIQGAIEGATTATQTLIGKVKELCGTEILNGLNSFKGYVDDIAKAWGDVKTKIDESTTALNGYIKKKADENKKENTSGKGAGTTPSTTPTTPSTPTPSQPTQPTTSTQGNGVINKGDKVTLKSGGKLANNSYDTPTLSTPYAGKQLYIQNIVDTNRRAPYHLGTTKDGYNNSNTWVGWVNKDQISGYDTGGYTGEWGSSGRMAFLHEKELILNKEDTKNILAAVNGIRQFSSVESAITKGIASMIMNMAGMGVNANYNTNEAKGNQTEQVFNITAEFPNANNVSEIREAILSLPGLASQQVGLNLI